jgi:hypothetical protein
MKRWIQQVFDFVTWWCWRRWQDPCPPRDISGLFDKPDFQNQLMDYDEAFVPPCSLHSSNSGGYTGKHTPKVMLVEIPDPDGAREESK